MLTRQSLTSIRCRLVAALLGALAAGIAMAGGSDRVGRDSVDWPSYGGAYSEQHFSPLTDINAKTVADLGLAWSVDLPGERTLEAVPLAVDGVLYFSGTNGKTYAVDARKGRILWSFDPDLAHHSPEKLRLSMGAHRGVAYWKGHIYVGLVDGRLVALDARTGRVDWVAQTFDSPKARKLISSAPLVFNGKVLIGHGGADFGTRGYVTAYDAGTGRQLWRFYTVPGDPSKGFESPAMAMAAKTWSGQWWRWGGGGTVWNGMTYDPELERVYLATGNGSPWNANLRSPDHGDNLFLCSIVALDAATGRYLWHYQVNPRESWDYDCTEQMALADLTIAGVRHKVLMQAPKNGFFYVLDRETGKLLSADKITKVTWADHVDLRTGRPVEIPNLRYSQGPVKFWPSSAGAHSWQPMSYSPLTGLVYIPVMKLGMSIGPARTDMALTNFENPHRRYFPLLEVDSHFVMQDPDDGTSYLLAWDPAARRKRWEVHYPASFWNGGTLTTAGNLVFQGTGRGQLIAYDATTGRKLWSFDAGLGIVAAPMTYEIDGIQYVSILVGYGGSAGNGLPFFDYGWRFGEQPRRLLTFALGQHAKLPPTGPPRFAVEPVDDPNLEIDPHEAERGGRLYNSTCFLCHGANAVGTGSIAPDLRESRLALSWNAFQDVLHRGVLAGQGMPLYDDLTDADLHGLFVYIREQAREAEAAQARSETDWVTVDGDLFNERYVALDQINTRNVSRLGAIWRSESFADGASSRMTPLVHDGRMFFAAGPRIYALDARTGKTLWVHQTDTRTSKSTGIQAMITGLAITRSWGLGLGGGMIFFGMMNGHIAALEEASGRLVWDRLINPEPLAVSKGITCPPLYVNGVLYLGLGQETTEGFVVAVDARTGRVLWRTPTIAEPGQPGHETWPAHSQIWRTGGADPWVSGAADPALGLVYFVTGNPSPDFGGNVRRGDNLYTVSVVALEMKSGRIRWHQQLVHHDLWEADLSVSPVLFDARYGGKPRKGIAVMRADGYLFLFDRRTGAPLIPVDERVVPQNPALDTSATQPFPRGAESILPPCESWRGRIPAGFVLGCNYDPPRHEVPNLLQQWASVRVAPMSYDPQTGFFYAQGANSLLWRSGAGDDPYLGETGSHGIDQPIPGLPTPTAVVAAIDGQTDRLGWRKQLPDYEGSGYKGDGGSLSTSGGLVFHQGGDGTLQAYDARSGEMLWKYQTDYAPGDAPPMSYAIDGKQYVAFIAGTKVWAFALGGGIPAAPPIPPPPHEEVSGPIEDTNQIEMASLQEAPANGHRYRISEYAFNPYRARITVGTPVTFINNGRTPHTLVASDGSWTTGTLGPTQIKTLTFNRPGTSIYYTKEYPWSYGELIVVPRSGPVSQQARAGNAAYVTSCAVCHGESLQGRDPAPPLVGNGFLSRWSGRTALDLFDRIKTTMPLNAPGSLDEDRYAAIVSFLLQANGQSVAGHLTPAAMRKIPVRAPAGLRPPAAIQ